MLNCLYCNKECKNSNSMRNHERLCALNPARQIISKKIHNGVKTKGFCEYCDKEYSLNNLNRHKNSCYLNPFIRLEKLKICPVCAKEFFTNGTTCSYSCSNTYFAKLRNKPETYSKYRTICFSEHKKECVICGETNIVEVHHYNEIHTDNTIDNLIPLCPTHHQYMHSKYKYLILNKIDLYKKQFNTARGSLVDR